VEGDITGSADYDGSIEKSLSEWGRSGIWY